MSKYSVENGIRLHLDAIRLLRADSYPSATLLETLAQEEVGKAFLIDEVYFRFYVTGEWNEQVALRTLRQALKDHKLKQRWFSSFAAQEELRWPKVTGLVKEVISGQLDERKMNSTYVGLPRKGGSLDWKGRINIPVRRSWVKVFRQIWRLNDFLMVYAEACSHEIYSVEAEEFNAVFTCDLRKKLEKHWQPSTPARKLIEKFHGYQPTLL